MTRRERQLDVLRELCATGAIAHAIDLAYEHFAGFGPDDHIAHLLAEAMEHEVVGDGLRRKFAELPSLPPLPP